ncbi:MAG: amino acid permease [Firmicutes bacterium]|nr:amino acid permease [Bacillota bacterium]
MSQFSPNVSDEEILHRFSYRAELRRTLGLFASFAVAFSFISMTTGIFTNFSFVLSTGGPAGIWTWPIVAAGQLLVAAVFADLASRIPLSGYSYQWIRRLATPGIGWFTGWMSFAFLALVVPAVDGGLAPVVAQVFGIAPTAGHLTAIVIVTILVQLGLNIFSVRATTGINSIAVFTEAGGFVGLAIALTIVAFIHHPAWGALVYHANIKGPYLGAFILSLLMGLFTIVGFEAAANLSEETHRAHQVVPRAIMSSVAIAGILGTLFLVAAVIAIPNMHAVLTASAPLPYIITTDLGRVLGTFFLVLVIISIFACGLVIMTSGGRLIFAMSRDHNFFVSGFFRRVSPRFETPIPALILLGLLGILGAVFSNSLTVLVGTTSVLPALIYLSTTLTYAVSYPRLPVPLSPTRWNRWGRLIAVVASAWLIFAVLVLTVPAEFHQTALWTAGILVLGVILYWAGFRRRIARTVESSR